jgi:multidrug resistance efflux pump
MFTILALVIVFVAGCAVGAKSASTVTADLAIVKADLAAVKAKVVGEVAKVEAKV